MKLWTIFVHSGMNKILRALDLQASYQSRWNYKLGKKRKSGGRSKGSSGKSGTVQCSRCGRIVPADKAKKYTKRVSAVEPQLARELRQQGTYIQTKRVTSYYCVSCAVHAGRVHIRQATERRTVPDRRSRT